MVGAQLVDENRSWGTHPHELYKAFWPRAETALGLYLGLYLTDRSYCRRGGISMFTMEYSALAPVPLYAAVPNFAEKNV